MSKEIVGYIKLTIPSGKANPSPPVGPALGQRGLNIMEFCKAFNDATKSLEPGTPVPVVITAFKDKSFTFVTKTPPASYYLKKVLKLKKGSSATRKEPAIARVTMDQCREIAKLKMEDLNANDIEAGAKIIAGSAISMGLEVVGG